MQNPKHIFITGASSGIGEALAKHYAGVDIRLVLTGRNAERLAMVAEACREKGASVQAEVIDVADQAAMAALLAAVDDAQPLDLVIANAGISGGTGGVMSGEPADQARTIFDVNLMGALNTIDPVLPKMMERGRGQIAIMGSLAGYRGWPSAPAYCGSKAAVKVYGEALRGAIWETGVRVAVICPGYVVSRITDGNDFPMPFLMETGKAARIIARGLAKDKSRISFPLATTFFAWLFAALPDGLMQGMLRRMPAKGSLD